MDRYQRVEKPRPEEPINQNEIRITAQGLIRNYISYATSFLQDKREKEIVLKAMGQAISKTVAIAEIIKKRLPGLHQDTCISSTTITDAYEPIEEGLEPLEMTRQVSLISITLSTLELNKNSPGYQAPSSSEQFNVEYEHPRGVDRAGEMRQDSYRGRGRRSRGRGRGRGHGRGDYVNYQGDNGGYYDYGRGRGDYVNQQGENDGYYDYGRSGGRGRGWGYRGMGYGIGRGGFPHGDRGGYGRGRGRGRMSQGRGGVYQAHT